MIIGVAPNEAIHFRDDPANSRITAAPGDGSALPIPEGTGDHVVAVAQEHDALPIGRSGHAIVRVTADQGAQERPADAIEQINRARSDAAKIVRAVAHHDIAIAQD